jgi:hypothetical protein
VPDDAQQLRTRGGRRGQEVTARPALRQRAASAARPQAS